MNIFGNIVSTLWNRWKPSLSLPNWDLSSNGTTNPPLSSDSLSNVFVAYNCGFGPGFHISRGIHYCY